jgi:hypothetical protein
VRLDLRLFAIGAVIAIIGALITVTVWRVAGIVVVMVGAAFILAARLITTRRS